MSDLRPIENSIRVHITPTLYINFTEVDHVLIFAARSNYQHFNSAYRQIYGTEPDAKTFLHYAARRPEFKAIAASTKMSDGRTLEQHLYGRKI